jgi:glucosamine--fructose-6-phosphate aminotransferase (isomerizing)
MAQIEIPASMAVEFREAPDVVQRQAHILARPVAELLARLASHPPAMVVTCARGSSAHAATFGKHLIERYLGIPVVAAAPNIATVYGGRLRLSGQLFLAVSQSGQSDDLIEMAHMAKDAGAVTAAIVNDTESPLVDACDVVLPMAAGPERSVAATKTFVATLATLLRLLADWTADRALAAALARLPQRLAASQNLDWSGAVGVLAGSRSLVSIGRGPTLAIAREASLKLKETCNLHAEAFSGAEFLHGPVALVSALYPTLLFMPTDQAAAGMQALAADLVHKGAAVLMTEGSVARPGRLPVVAAEHPETDAVCLIQSFYGLVVDLAERLGISADRPRHLQKVTRTR